MVAFLCIFGNIHFFLTKSGLNHVYSFLSCSFPSALYKELFHISDHSFWKLFSSCTACAQGNGEQKCLLNFVGPGPLTSVISQLSAGHRGCSVSSADSLEWMFLFTPQPSHRPSGAMATWAQHRAFCHFLMSQHMCCPKYTEHLFVFSNIQIIYFD